jgi:hypothetical protein
MQAETGGITDEAEIRGEIALGFTPYSGQPNHGLKELQWRWRRAATREYTA